MTDIESPAAVDLTDWRTIEYPKGLTPTQRSTAKQIAISWLLHKRDDNPVRHTIKFYTHSNGFLAIVIDEVRTDCDEASPRGLCYNDSVQYFIGRRGKTQVTNSSRFFYGTPEERKALMKRHLEHLAYMCGGTVHKFAKR